MIVQTHSNLDNADLTWPDTPSALMILGKRQGTRKENKQLWGRVALAAALWHSAPQPKPYIFFAASDVHGPARTPDAEIVRRMLVEKFELPSDYLILRRWANCTMLEVRAARTLGRIYHITQTFILTHLYHAQRAQRYFNEVHLNAGVIPVHPDILLEISFPESYADLLPDLRALIGDSQPTWLDLSREHIIEWLLGRAHTIDPRGRFERTLAHILRPTAYG